MDSGTTRNTASVTNHSGWPAVTVDARAVSAIQGGLI